jgi:hypothetical protein
LHGCLYKYDSIVFKPVLFLTGLLRAIKSGDMLGNEKYKRILSEISVQEAVLETCLQVGHDIKMSHREISHQRLYSVCPDRVWWDSVKGGNYLPSSVGTRVKKNPTS